MTHRDFVALSHAGGVARSWNQATPGDWAKVLATFPLFKGISKRRLRKLVRHARLAEFTPGEAIIVAGDPTDTLYVILGGRAKTLATSASRRLSTGDYFGEVALTEGRSPSATVVATSDVHAMRFPARSVLKLARRHPALAARLVGDLTVPLSHLGITLEGRRRNAKPGDLALNVIDHRHINLEQRLWTNPR